MRTLEEIYASLPEIQCQRQCQNYCGPVAFFPAEVQNLWQAGKQLPVVSDSTIYGGLTCSALNARGNCRIYEQRPLICRLYGVVRALQCPYGCVPSRWLTDKEADQLKQEIELLKAGAIYFSEIK